EPLAARLLVNRITKADVRLDPMEVQVHERQPAGPRNEVLPEVGLRADALRYVTIKGALGLRNEPLIGAHEKAAGADRGVADGEVGRRPRVGLHTADDRLDEDARREVLAR